MAQNEQMPAEEDDHSADANSFSTLTTRKSVTKEVANVPLVMVADGSHSSTPKSPMRAHTTSEASAEADHSPNRKSLLGCNRFLEDACSECCTDENNLLQDNNSEFQSNYSINELPGYHLKGDLILNQLPAPPDGGFGWVIVGAAFLCNLVVDGVSNSFGSFVSAYQTAFRSSKAATSVIGSLLIGVYLLAGPISGALLNTFEARKVVIAGAVLSSAAFALSSFSPNIFVHYLLYGVFGGIGFSFIFLPAIVIVSQYFEAKRALATGISVAGSGFGTFLIPLLLKFFLETFGWKAALYVTALLTLSCAFFAILFRPLPMPAFDLEKQNKLNEELKQQALLAALQQVESSESDVSEEEEANNGGISPPRRSGVTRTSSECTDGQPLLMANGGEMGAGGGEQQAEEGNELDVLPITPHNRPPLSPILEGVSRRLSKKRGGSQHHNPQQQQQQGGTEAGGTVLGRHPTIVSTRTRKPTLTSVTSESVWMGSSTQLRQSRLNLCSQLSRVSARSYAQSLSRISQAPAQSIKAVDSVLSVALSGAEPKEFARPLSRNDIFLQGSIRNLKEFENEGGNFHRYRGSQISIPLTVAAQNLSSVVSQVGAGEMAESHSCRFGGSQYSRITGGAFGVGDFEEDEPGPANDSKLRCIPLPIRYAVAQMVDVSLLFEPVMSVICLSNILAMLGFYVPFVFLTDFASSKGISDAEATFLLPFIGIANTLGRVFFGWMADRRWVTALSITNFSLVLCGLLTALCPLLPNFWSLSLYACLFGFIVAAYVCLTSIVLADLLGVERLTNSFGLVVVSRGFASLLGTPIAGVVYDLSDSYSASFVYAGFLILLSGLVSCLVPTMHRHQRSQLKNEGDYEDKLKRPTTTTVEQDAQSGKLSVLTERSEENLTEYQRTIQSINQQRALMYELDEYRKRSQRLDEGHEDEAEEGGAAEAAQCREGEAEAGDAETAQCGTKDTEAAKGGTEDTQATEEETGDAEAAKRGTGEAESVDPKVRNVKAEDAGAQKAETANIQADKTEAVEVGNDSQLTQQNGERDEADISMIGINSGNSAIPLQVV